ncbi:putative hydrolase YxeP [compost metagenome]|jgi:hippurate hydrolase|uniref:M20 aminoacylase family protein n=1 Tax=unclassified Pseudomonas TaxID=196821 RepID=UPI000F9B13F1|nr:MULTISPECIES: M20 aminoacylase family protein [unclassified Pseudomonas]VVO92143.1 Hippurate hydrolase [Pseudomonas fluorescens]VVO96211.1 Hippurate hydrolase [Pseudomonas fluorescens]VVP24931.1 Hippurate hydrolase [Pseudomonas fluorescens]
MAVDEYDLMTALESLGHINIRKGCQEMPQKIIDQIRSQAADYEALRRDLHAHPELGFDEHRTVEVICAALDHLSIPYQTGIGRTGIVGVIPGRATSSGRAIGLRADMDALPVRECTKLDYASTREGRMHACGHDGHVTMLLAAADYLQKTRDYDGTVYLIFQPGEEGYNGGLEMVNDGLFERFPIEQVYALHNWPTLPLGTIAVPIGAVMAASDIITIKIQGRGGHGGVAPQYTVDPVLIAGAIISAVHSIVGRNLNPLDTGVISLCGISGGSLEAFNVIPDEVVISGTVRSLRAEVQETIESRLREIVEGVARSFGGSATLEYRKGVPATINSEAEALLARQAAIDVVGVEHVVQQPVPSLGGEDFSFMLAERPGAYIHLGTGDGKHCHGLHSAYYDFNDAATPIGSALLARIAELSMPLHA